MSLVFMFPGQGSQSVGMMSDLLASSNAAKAVFEQASSAINIDLAELALSGPEERINQTEITQPLILTASVAVWKEWLERGGVSPEYLCGHSLGEYTALVASEVISLKDAVSLVHLRGQLMQGAVPLGEGAMAALLGLEDDVVESLCAEAAQDGVVSAANFNSPGQVVIAGSNAALERALVLAKERGARRAAMLPVSVPCHCSLLEPAGQKLAEAINSISFADPTIPIIQNYTASIPSSLDELKANLLEHLHQPVRWSDSIRKLVEMGADVFVECGPGKVLAGLNKRIDKSVSSYAMSDIESIESVQLAIKGDS